MYVHKEKMKRKKKTKGADRVLFDRVPDHRALEPSLWAYLQGPFCHQVRFDASARCYVLTRGGTRLTFSGLLSQLKWTYYPKYKDNRSRRKRGTYVRGSNSEQGKNTDARICQVIAAGGKRPARLNKFARVILDYWEDNGHQLQAGQVPVELEVWGRITQADAITRHKRTGKLWMWEIKTGYPVGAHMKQGKFNAPLGHVDATKMNIWELQRHFTVQGLVEAGVQIRESRIIHVHVDRRNGSEPLVKVRKPAPWTRTIPKPKIKGMMVRAATYKPVVYGEESSEEEEKKKPKRKTKKRRKVIDLTAEAEVSLPKLSGREFPTGRNHRE